MLQLWLWSLSGEGLDPRGMLCGALDRLPILDALDIALISMLIRGADGDDSLGPGHLHLEVGVVGDHHELGVSWVPDDVVISASKTQHFESEGLLFEVGHRAKADQ